MNRITELEGVIREAGLVHSQIYFFSFSFAVEEQTTSGITPCIGWRV
jgi:hypothetical protein